MPGSGLCEMDYPHHFPSPPTNSPDEEELRDPSEMIWRLKGF